MYKSHLCRKLDIPTWTEFLSRRCSCKQKINLSIMYISIWDSVVSMSSWFVGSEAIDVEHDCAELLRGIPLSNDVTQWACPPTTWIYLALGLKRTRDLVVTTSFVSTSQFIVRNSRSSSACYPKADPGSLPASWASCIFYPTRAAFRLGVESATLVPASPVDAKPGFLEDERCYGGAPTSAEW